MYGEKEKKKVERINSFLLILIYLPRKKGYFRIEMNHLKSLKIVCVCVHLC